MNKVKNSLFIAIITSFIITGCNSTYAEEGTSYIDISWGVTSATIGDVKNSTTGNTSSSNTRIDEEDEGYAIVFGTKLSDSIAGELSFVDLGEVSIVGDDPNDSFSLQGNKIDFTGAETIKSEIDGFGLGLALQSSGDGNFIASLRAGALLWDSSGTKADATTADTFVNSVLFDSGIDPYMGFSVKYNISNVTIGAGYDSYGLNGFDDASSLMSLSIGGIV